MGYAEVFGVFRCAEAPHEVSNQDLLVAWRAEFAQALVEGGDEVFAEGSGFGIVSYRCGSLHTIRVVVRLAAGCFRPCVIHLFQRHATDVGVKSGRGSDLALRSCLDHRQQDIAAKIACIMRRQALDNRVQRGTPARRVARPHPPTNFWSDIEKIST